LSKMGTAARLAAGGGGAAGGGEDERLESEVPVRL